MLELDAREFVSLTNCLRSITLMGREFPDRAEQGGHGDKNFADVLRRYSERLGAMGLKTSKGALLSLAHYVERYGPYNDLANQKAGSVCEILYLETEGRKFLQVQRDDLYAPTGPLFGEKVDLQFPTVAEEIVEAGKCLALGRGTACVMHLMRILEVGLHCLADEMKVPFENQNWGKIIDLIEKNIKGMSSVTHGDNWKVEHQFFSEAAVHFWLLKDAWRNHAMHIHERYSEERAEAIFQSVRAYMQHLATRLSDPLAKMLK